MDGRPFHATQPKLRFQGMPASQPYSQNPLNNLLLGSTSQHSSLEGLPHSPCHHRPIMGTLAGSSFPTRACPLHGGVKGPPPSPFCAAALLQSAAATMPAAAAAVTAGQLGLAPLPFSSSVSEPQDPLADGLELLEVLTDLESSLSQVDSSSMLPEPMAVPLPDNILAWAACGPLPAGSPHRPDPGSCQAAVPRSHLGAASQILQQRQLQQHCLQQPSLAPAVGASRLSSLVGCALPPCTAAPPGGSTCGAGCTPVHGGQLATPPYAAAGTSLAAPTPTTPMQHTQQLMLPQPKPFLGQLNTTGSGACFGSMAGHLSSCPLPRELEDLELDLDGLDLPELDLEKQGGPSLPAQELLGSCLATPPSRDSGCLRQTSSGVPMLLPQYEPPATHAGGAATLCLPLAGPDLPSAAHPTADLAVSPPSDTALCATAAPLSRAAQPWPQLHKNGHSHTVMTGSATACGTACSMLGKRRRSLGQPASASASHELEDSLECGSTAEGPAQHGGAAIGPASSPSGALTTPQAQQAQRRRVAWEQYELDEEEVAALLEPVRALPRISEASEEEPRSETAGASATSAGHSCPPAAAITCIKAGVDPPSDSHYVTFLLPPLGGGPPQPTQCSFLFQKQLTSSDTGRLGRIVLPSVQAHKWFPDIFDKAGLDLWFLDSEGGEHCVTFKYWQNGKPHKLMYLFEGTRDFCTNKHLKAGCHLAFYCTPAGRIVVDTVAVEVRISKQA